MKDQDAAIEELLEKAENLEKQDSRLEAMQLLRHASTLREDPVVLTRIGALAISLELWLEAEAALQTATRLESDFTPAYVYLGLLYQTQGRLEEALSCLNKAANDEPSSANLTVLGVIQTSLALMNDARASFRKAISLDPTHEEAYFNLATIMGNDEKEEAIALLQQAIDIDSKYSLAHRELGLLLRRTNQLPEAEYHLRRAIELDSSDGWAHIYLGNLMWARGDLTSAKDAFRKSIEVWADRSVPYWSFAHFLESQGQSQEAGSLYKKALELDPGDAQANWRFGSYLKDIGDSEQAKCYLRRALDLDPSENRARAALSTLK